MTLAHVKNQKVFHVSVNIKERKLAPHTTQQQNVPLALPSTDAPKNGPIGAWIGQIEDGEKDDFKKALFSIGGLSKGSFNIHIHSCHNQDIKLTNVKLKVFLIYPSERHS